MVYISGKPFSLASFDASKLSLVIPAPRADIKAGKFGATYFVRYNEGVARFEFPVMRAPFGIQESDLAQDRTLQTAFDLKGDCLTAVQAIEDAMVNLIVANKAKLYKDGESASDETIRGRIAKFVRVSDKGYAPSLRATIETSPPGGETVVSLPRKPLLIDEHKKPINVSRSNITSIVGRNSHLQPVLEIKQIFVTNALVTSVKWALSHAKLVQSVNDEANDWELEDTSPVAPPPTPASSVGSEDGTNEDDPMDSD